MAIIRQFEELGRHDVQSAGGKGANLGELTRAGLPVPPGFVLSTEAYDSFVASHELLPQIINLVSEIDQERPDSYATASEAITHLILGEAIADEMASKILDAYHRLVGEGADAVAVRSSATAEDLPTASFAGQQETFLNIKGDKALLDGIQRCWASLWSARALAYRDRQKIEPSNVSIAVVVQKLIPADSAGILFTANPVSGERDQLLINATWGLGEAIVGGLVTPDSIVVDKTAREIIFRETAQKSTMTVRTESGTEERDVPSDQRNRQVLDDATALALADLGILIESHYSMPMDIEWAIADGQIAILQARAITTLPQSQAATLGDVSWEPVYPDTIWMRRQIVEHISGPVSPLFEDLYIEQGMERTMDWLLGTMNTMADTNLNIKEMMPYNFIGTVNGFAYTAASFRANPAQIWEILKIYSRLNRFFKMKAFDWDEVALPTYRIRTALWAAVDLPRASDEILLQGIGELAMADSMYWFGSAVNLGLSRTVDSLFNQFLKSPLIADPRAESPLSSADFLRGFDSRALDAQADMEEMAADLRQSVPLRELVQETEARDLMRALSEHPDGLPHVEAIQRYLATYGHQIYNLDFADPTQSEDPLPLLLSLKTLVGQPPAEPVRTRQRKMAAERDALVADTMERLNPLARHIFAWAWKWTKRYAPYRESVMFYMGNGWPTLRKLAHELGRRLTEAHLLADPDDIYYLDSEEISQASQARAGGEEDDRFITLARERRALRDARSQLTPPARIPERATLKFGPLDLSMFDPTPGEAVEDGPVLHGYAVSSGRVTAPASVIRTLDEFERMKPGTILVCTTTTPAWTPLFSQAKGLVTDVGGALAHGSIVAREYGIPAVMGTGVATSRIRSGMMLTVDGNAGTVVLEEDV